MLGGIKLQIRDLPAKLDMTVSPLRRFGITLEGSSTAVKKLQAHRRTLNKYPVQVKSTMEPGHE